MRKRNFLRMAGLAAALPWVRVQAAPTVAIGGPMAGSLYFTRDEPGIWSSEVERHLPIVETEPAPGGTTGLTLSTAHPMDGCAHYIVKHKLLDARFRLLSQKTFAPGRDRPVSKHVLPAGYRGPVYAVSICNLHDMWIEGVMIG